MILLSLSSLLSNVLILDLNRSIFFSNSSMSSWSKWSLISLRNSFWTVSFSLIGTNPISAQRVWKAFKASMSSSLLPVNLKLRTSSISSRFSSRFFSWSEETCLNCADLRSKKWSQADRKRFHILLDTFLDTGPIVFHSFWYSMIFFVVVPQSVLSFNASTFSQSSIFLVKFLFCKVCISWKYWRFLSKKASQAAR